MLALLPCFQTSVWAGDDPTDIPVTRDLNPNPNPDPNPPGGPRARARARFTVDNLTCTYYNGEVTIEADSNITFISASVERVEDNATWSDAGIGDTLVLSVSSDPGSYILTFTLSNGNSYIGKYILY